MIWKYNVVVLLMKIQLISLTLKIKLKSMDRDKNYIDLKNQLISDINKMIQYKFNYQKYKIYIYIYI